ncbi:2,5-didehydrogluconate reductase [Tersicoccus solisilvae]|uniref:2,5-didehydrogluconate reductase n=1 Tax=Tersicoccus solisilvae TaxID=1882339 RepID=A0ABQ1P3T7_9MICC|nr:aldo/keto reductase [Tersicoccus solisilvae]GGC90606.1 2,5-didehydrogluconate reductase [Tersicoccus solisilvae]
MTIASTKTFRGVSVPTFGIGTWEVAGQHVVDAVTDGLAAGYRHIDTAQAYGNEEQVGTGLKKSGVARDAFWLTSKVWIDSFAPEALRTSTERSLRLLGVDHLDLMLLHWPTGGEDTVRRALDALATAKADGLVREYGVSNVPAGMLRRLFEHDPDIFADQVEYHAHLSQDALLNTARARDLMITAYSPLANGRGLIEDPVITQIASEANATPAQVALAWLAGQESVTVLPRSTDPDRRRENLGALEVELSAEQTARLTELSQRNERYLDPQQLAPDWTDE